ncbi:MAG: GNAT family N-acetyltransferase [bacterium]
MIIELDKEEFHKVRHLLEGRRINLEIKAVVEGYNPGWVFVDNTERPNTAMVWSRGIEGCYFIGDVNNSFFNKYINLFIDEKIAPRAKKMGLDVFEFSGTSAEWDENLELVFNKRNIHKSKQFVYINKSPDNIDYDNYIQNLDKGYIVRKVDLDLLRNRSLDLEYVISAIYEWWDSIEDFLNNSIGYCIIHNDTTVCSCLTSFMTKDMMESHIKTREEYRKRGLATRAVAEFLKYCGDNDYTAYWDCMEANYGSRALAEKFGYSKEYDYKLYWFKF